MPPAKNHAPAPLIWTQPTPAERRLNREQIVRAAVAVADQGGVRALTMAAVARHLGSYTAMALYRHVPNKEALVDLMIDQVTAEVALPETASKDWRAELQAVAGSSWEMVMRHRWYAQLVHTRPPLGPNVMRRTEHILEILTRQGATPAQAMTYAALLDQHIFGAALQAAEEHDMRERHGVKSTDELAAAITATRELVADDSYPILSSWMAAPTITGPDEQFELALTFLLEGIAKRLPKRRRGQDVMRDRGA
jgi:AcrR family transcriptional regulator